MNNSGKANAVGINHVALEVGNVQEALDFYGAFLNFEIESQSDTAAFIYFGDQFINFMAGRTQSPDQGRHFGIAVDDKEQVRQTITAIGVQTIDTNPRFLDFLDPWGNRVEITTYQKIQFTKDANVLKGMGLTDIEKTTEALKELADKGMA